MKIDLDWLFVLYVVLRIISGISAIIFLCCMAILLSR